MCWIFVTRFLFSRRLTSFPFISCFLSTEEDFAGRESPLHDSHKLSKTYCAELVQQVCPSTPLPTECHKYPDVLQSLRRRDSDRHEQTIAFEGMAAGEKAAAMAARDKGRLSQAQIKRRMTSPTVGSRHNSWW